MANEIIKRDQNRITVLAAVTDDGNEEIRQLLVDPSTGRLLVSATGGGVVPSFADEETPSGAINGTNVTFTLAHTPSPATSLQLFLNGQLLTPVGEDYTLSGDQITLNLPPDTDSILRAWYRY